jgi:hypothetical protein
MPAEIDRDESDVLGSQGLYVVKVEKNPLFVL